MSKVRRSLVAAVGLAAASLALTACSGGGGTTTETSAAATESSTGSTSAPAAAGGDIKVYMVGGQGDPFFNSVKRGADDAAKYIEAQGGSFTYLALPNYENLGVDAAKLTQTAISNGASIILVPDWVPESQNPAIQAAKDAGIPVMLYNAGADQKEKVGALGYVGADDYTSGLQGGEYLGSKNVSNILCINTVPGAINLEARCKGISDGVTKSGGKSTQLPLPASNFGNATAVTQAVKAALLKDPSINGVVTMGGQDANSAAAAIEQAGVGDKVSLGSFDVNAEGLDRIKKGTQLMLIDQQGYLQGNLTPTLAFQYVKWGLLLPGDVLTGPLVIDSSNVDAAVSGAAEGVR